MQVLIKRLNKKNLSTLIKRVCCLLMLSILCSLCLNCGKRKPPQPPIERVQQRVSIDGTQIGDQIRIVWQMPARNAKDKSLLNIDRVEIYRLAESLDSPLSLTQAEFASQSILIASVSITDADFALKDKTYVDQLQFAGQAARLRYAIRFVNSSGQKAAFSNFLIIQPSSRIASNPTSLRGTVSQEQIDLIWNAPGANVDGSTPTNILGYNVYRSSAEELTRRLNDRPIELEKFADQFFAFDKTYKYFVRTVSIGTNGEQVESVSSDTLQINTIDTFAPAPPDAISIAASPNNISIFFAINIEKDVLGYKIFRTTDLNSPKENWDLLTKDILKANTFQDLKVEAGKTYYYYLTAVDQFGNESKPSVVVSETAF